MGQMNRIPAEVKKDKVKVLDSLVSVKSIHDYQRTDLVALIRPEALEVSLSPKGNSRVVARSFLGPMSKVLLQTLGGVEFQAVMTSEQSTALHSGDIVQVKVKAGEYLVVAA